MAGPSFIVGIRALLLSPVVGWREAGFLPKELSEVAWVGVAYFAPDRDHVFGRFTKQAPRGVHAKLDLILQRRQTGRTFEEASEVELALSCLLSESSEAELVRKVCGHPVRNASQLESRQRRSLIIRGLGYGCVISRQMNGDRLTDSTDEQTTRGRTGSSSRNCWSSDVRRVSVNPETSRNRACPAFGPKTSSSASLKRDKLRMTSTA